MIYRVIVKFTVSQTPARRLLSHEFYQAAIELESEVCLEILVNIRERLLLTWPTCEMRDNFYGQFRVMRRSYNTKFPNHTLRELSRVLRLASWIIPDESTIP